MSDFGTFGTFTTARLGMYAAQKGLSVTGNNIANINTRGYTRQTLDQVSLKLGSNDRFQAYGTANVGSGVLCIGVSQLRDPYLDIRYRTEMSNVGAMNTKLAGLNDLSSILDEVAKNDGDGILEKQLTDLMDALQDLSLNAGQDEFDTAVREAASTLAKTLNSYANKLEGIHKDTADSFKGDIKAVNNILTNIRDLNASIRQSEIHGDSALEQRDQRNLLIDQLSEYMKIEVTYTTENIGNDQTIEKLVIKLGNANPDSDVTTDSSTLVDGIFATQLLTPKENLDANGNLLDPPYLDIDGNPTSDPGAAAQAFNKNYDIILGKLTDVKDRVRRSSNILNSAEPDSTNYDAYIANGGNPLLSVPTDNGDGTQTYTATEYIKKPMPMLDADGKPIKDTDGNTLMEDKYFKVTTTYTESKPVSLDDNDLYGSLQSKREMLTEKGEFATAADLAIDEKATIKRGIPYYQKTLDALANKIADIFNQANRTERRNYETYTDAGDGLEHYKITSNCALDTMFPNKWGTLVDLTSVPAEYHDAILAAQDEHLSREGLGHGYPIPSISGPLFSNSGDGNDTVGITAKNISISHGWSSGEINIVCDQKPGSGSQSNTNIEHLLAQMTTKFEYKPSDIVDGASDTAYFKGTFHEMLAKITSTLGSDKKSTATMLDNYYSSAIELDSSRDSVSSVDLNDEAMGLMQYQKSYSAAARLMTTLDEVLDKLINGTGVVGR